MKKLFSKIAALSVGLALAIGFGVAVGHEAREVKASEQSFTINTSSNGVSNWGNGSYGSGALRTATAGGFSIHAHYATRNNLNQPKSGDAKDKYIQVQKNNANIYNVEAIGSKIKSIVITQTAVADWSLYAGTEQLFSDTELGTGKTPTSGTLLTSPEAATVMTWNSTDLADNLSKSDYTHFCLHLGGTNTFISSIVITYDNGPTKLATPSPIYNNDTHKVTWADVEHATSYEVSLDNSTYTAATSPYDGSFVDGTQYTVYVRALSSDADYSTSDPGSVTFTPTVPPVYESVTVSKGELQGNAKGSAYIQCTAVVNGQHDPSQDVTWSITENSTFGTGTSIANKATIDQTGKVVFLDNVESLYVWALAADGETKGNTTISASGLIAEKGTEGNPYTVGEAYDVASGLAVGANNGKVVYVSGIATGSMSTGKFGATFDLTDGEHSIKAYSIAGAQTTNDSADGYVGAGYLVTVTGAIINHSTGGYEVGYVSNDLPSALISSVAPSYTISFNANGGSGEMASIPDQHGSYTLPANGFTAPENTFFAGWKANNAGDTIAAGGSYQLTGDVTFYAQWGAIRTLTVNVTNGSAEAPETITENGSATITLSPAEGYKLPDLAGITVTGATKVSLTDGALVINNPTSNVTVTVNCVELANYTITVTANNCTYEGASSIQEKGEATITFTANDGYVLPSNPTSISGATVKSFSNGELVIHNPTGNVSITMNGVQYDNDFNIVSGAQYKIHHTKANTTDTYYLKSNGTSSVPSATKNTWEATLFVFSLVGNNTFEIKNGSDYLYTTDSNNGLRVGSTKQTWKLLTGTSGKTGAYELQNQSYKTRYLALFGTQDFRTYNVTQENRTENTDLTNLTSSVFAQDLLSATNTVCSQSGSHTASQFSDMWGLLETSYKALPSADKTAFDTADRNEGGTVLEQAAARYDQVAGKYSLKNFASRTPILVRSTTPIFDSGAKNFGYILVISISGLTILAIGLLLVYKRKHR